MTDLVTWYLAQLDAEEAAARAAQEALPEGRWWVDGPAQASSKFWVYATGEKFQHEATAAHIARHDPARVLAEVAAKRAIVEIHAPRYAVFYREPDRLLADALDSQTVPTVAHSGPHWPTIHSEATLRALASVYEGAPGWQEEWR